MIPHSFPVGRRIAILGTGDLAGEVMQWLVKAEGEREVILIDPALGPWIPAHRGCSPLQLRRIAHAIDPLSFANEVKRIEALLQHSRETPASLQQKLTAVRQKIESSSDSTQASLQFRLLSSVRKIVSEGGRISGLEFEQNRISRQAGTLSVQPTGQLEHLAVDTLIYASSDEQEWMFYPREGHSASLSTLSSFSHAMQNNSPCDGCFVAGWARTPTLGVNVGKARKDGEKAAQ